VRLWKRLGRTRTLPALQRLLATFTFRSIREVYADELTSTSNGPRRDANEPRLDANQPKLDGREPAR
jgi:hypothetical protein